MKLCLVKFQEAWLSEISRSKGDIWEQEDFFTGALQKIPILLDFISWNFWVLLSTGEQKFPRDASEQLLVLSNNPHFSFQMLPNDQLQPDLTGSQPLLASLGQAASHFVFHREQLPEIGGLYPRVKSLKSNTQISLGVTCTPLISSQEAYLSSQK